MRRINIAILAFAAVVMAFTACNRNSAPVHKEAVTVKVIPGGVSSDGIITNTYVGKVETGNSAVVSSNNAGTVTKLRVKAGDSVKAGQRIAVVESQTVQSAYKMAKATLDQAQDAYDRVSKVYESGSVAEVKMVDIKTDLEKAKAAYEAARRALEQCTVKAPFSGAVSEVYAANGSEVVVAAPIIKVVSVADNEIHFSVPEAEVSSIKIGQDAEVEIPAIKLTVNAKVSSKGVVASQLSHSYDCVLSGVSKVPGLMPGMVCKVKLFGNSDKSVVIPATAIMTDSKGRYVWTVDEYNYVGKMYVTVAGYSGTGIVVNEVFPKGTSIIVEGSRKVSTGMRVQTVE